jgi:hypothetical protein
MVQHLLPTLFHVILFKLFAVFFFISPIATVFNWFSQPVLAYRLTLILTLATAGIVIQSRHHKKAFQLSLIPFLALFTLICLYYLSLLKIHIFVYLSAFYGLLICIIMALLSAYVGHRVNIRVQEICLIIALSTPILAGLLQFILQFSADNSKLQHGMKSDSPSAIESISATTNQLTQFSNTVINKLNNLLFDYNYYLVGLLISVAASLINVLFNKQSESIGAPMGSNSIKKQ